MSGTIGNEKRKRRELEASKVVAEASVNRMTKLNANRQKVKDMIVEALGWDKLDVFAEEMLDKAFRGKTIDIKQLAVDLENWKSEQ